MAAKAVPGELRIAGEGGLKSQAVNGHSPTSYNKYITLGIESRPMTCCYISFIIFYRITTKLFLRLEPNRGQARTN